MYPLKKNLENRIIAGVCSGIANFFDISPFTVRLIFILTGAVPIYFILALLLPTE
ncbi:PspC domain-containing protein [Enterococcus nangangensis]|uniref:PspC domain-containing protein n=1 Tax=Enterococcus nangangensis TaxID=2559926 RepID=UPI0010F954AB|nr:PspC domain-containing protein [Enterococcus nangangensis]